MTRLRNTILHILFLTVLFIASVLFFERFINNVAPDTAETMESSTFPLVYMERGGVNFNCLHGYAREMDVSYMRDSITPLTNDRQIGVRVQTFSASVEDISYEVLTLDGRKSLEHTKVIKTTKDGDVVSATLQLQNHMLMNQEYMLKLQITSGGRNIYYYTHVLLADGLHTDDYLNFVSGFYDKTVNGTDLASVGAAVEPDETTDAEQTLAYMDIHDSVSQLTWGNLKPQIYYKPTPRIKEINTNTASLTMEYRIASVNENGITEIFNVDEFYRVRFTDSRVFLLNFERTTDEIFNPENHVLEDTGIRLGVTGKDVEYKSDPKGRVVAFVQENELWTYERSTSRLTMVFSFPQKENMDIRDFYDAHDIRILRVSENGDVWFTVSGYMNRGQHEGDNGVSVFFYEAATDLVDETVFLECMESGERLENDINSLAYVTGDNDVFCCYLDGKLYRVNLSDRRGEVLVDGICECCYSGSPGGRYFAWLKEGEAYDSSTLCEMDMESGQIREIAAGDEERIRPVCYLNDDLVYGLAKVSDLEKANLESGYFPMYKMVISAPDGTELKTYEPGGALVTAVEQSEHMLSLTRVARGTDGFVPGTGDEIMDLSSSDSVSMGAATKQTDRKQTIVYLRVGDKLTNTRPEVVRSKVVKYTASRTVTIPGSVMEQDIYYVYFSGKMQEIFTRENEAVKRADEHMGQTLDPQWHYVWVRGDRETTADIQVDRVPAALRSGAIGKEALEAAFAGKTGNGTGISGAGETTENTTEDAEDVVAGLVDAMNAADVPDGADASDGMDITDDSADAASDAGSTVKVLDLSGNTLDEVLYMVSHGRAVQAVGDKGVVTIVGYDEFNTHLLDPGTDEWYYYGINDSTEMFAKHGNQFYSYLE